MEVGYSGSEEGDWIGECMRQKTNVVHKKKIDMGLYGDEMLSDVSVKTASKTTFIPLNYIY